MTPNEFAASEKPPVPFSMVPRNALQGAGPVTLRVPPQVLNFGLQGTVEVVSTLPSEPDFRGSMLLGVFPSTIDFPAEDADVTVISPSLAAVEVEPADAGPDLVSDEALPAEPESSATIVEITPSASLEALANVHLEEPVEQRAPVENAPAAVDVAPEPPVAVIPEPSPIEPPAVAEAASATDLSSPRASTEFIEIPVRSFAPPKPVPTDGAALVREKTALLPRLTGLPLRPKMALAPNQSPSAAKATAAKAAPAKSPTVPAKEAVPPNAQVSAREKEEKQPVKPVAVNPPAAPKTTKPPAAARPAKPSSPGQPATPAAKNQPPVEAAAAKPPVTPAPAQKAPAPKESPAPAPAIEAAKPVLDTEAPTFGTSLGNPTIWGSLKVKLGIALLLVIVSCTAYFGWGAKSGATLI